jgi:hypothetical protein
MVREKVVMAMEESQPTRTWPLVAIGMSQSLMLWFAVWLAGYAFSMAMSLGGSGQGEINATLVVCMAFVPFIGSALYASYDAGHSRPIIRALIGIVVYGVTALASIMLLVPFLEHLWAAVPLIAVGTMLVVVLPGTDLFWNLLRIVLPTVSGVSVAVVMSVVDAARDVPFDWWIWVITGAYLIGLGSVRIVEIFRPSASFRASPVQPDEHIDDNRSHDG